MYVYCLFNNLPDDVGIEAVYEDEADAQKEAKRRNKKLGPVWGRYSVERHELISASAQSSHPAGERTSVTFRTVV